MLLIHGFGASAYHWRYTIPELAKTHRVFAIDLLGFGWSDKPLVEYSKYEVWPEQLAAFVKEVGSTKVSGCAARCLHALKHSNNKSFSAFFPPGPLGISDKVLI